MDITLATLIIEAITLINLLFIIATVFIERKKPVTAVAWILILTFVPVIGFFLYLIFGRSLRVNKKRIFKLKKEYDTLYNSRLKEQKHLLDHGKLPFAGSLMERYRGIIEMHLNMSGSMYTEDNNIEIFTDAKEKYDALLRDTENAENSIHLLYFIINNDHIGRRVVDLLAKKAGEGVTVRLL